MTGQAREEEEEEEEKEMVTTALVQIGWTSSSAF